MSAAQAPGKLNARAMGEARANPVPYGHAGTAYRVIREALGITREEVTEHFPETLSADMLELVELGHLELGQHHGMMVVERLAWLVGKRASQ